MIGTKEILDIMPETIKKELQSINNFNEVQEVRVRVNKPLMCYRHNNEIISSYITTKEDIKVIVQRISNYSVYAFEEEIKQGYITIKGGHRIGISGDCVIEGGRIKTIKNVSSLNVRICKQIMGCSDSLMHYITENNRIYNTIIISPPKCGKTTLLRDITRNLSNGINRLGLKGKKVAVIDERSEIAGCFEGNPQMDVGIRTDVYDNCIKSEGIMVAIRCMSPDVVICDEIGTKKDIESVIMALNCGINLITSMHGYGVEDMKERFIFKDILDNKVFSRAIILSNRNGIGTLEYVYDIKNNGLIWGNKND